MGAQAVRLSNVDIDNALKNKDFEVLFQPIFDLGNGALARVETFVRWRHPSLGVLPPGAFISFFESQGRMSELTRYVLGEALKHYCAWRGPSAPGFSINLALSDLSDDAFAGRFAVLLRDRGFPADLITLECPMPPVTMEVEAAAESFHRLAETGARLAIEVRGRANDFLRQLHPFPFDEIKTGGAAILRFARTVRGPGLSAISELLEIAQKANAAITAVGVEDQASLAALRGLGFAAAQGNHLGKVAPLEAFAPSRVNEVRTLLGLEPLAQEDLNALFRTEAPAPQPAAETGELAPRAPTLTSTEEAPDEDALVERLAQRLARQAAQEKAAAAERPAAPAAKAKKPTPSPKDLKAAAIARAKRKAAENSADADHAEARSLQQRLTREFAGAAPVKAAKEGEDAPEAKDDEFSFAGETPTNDIADGPQEQETAMSGHVKTRPGDGEQVKPAEQPATEPALEDAPAEKASGAAPLAAAMAQSESAGDKTGLRSLSVAGANAYFRPGYHVGAIAPPRSPAQISEPPAPSGPEMAEPVMAQPETASPPVTEEGSEGVASDFEISAIDIDDDAEGGGEAFAEPVQAEEIPAPAVPRRRRKPRNFLTRKYHVWPTHFWPKSWKRAWRRRRLDRQSTEHIAAE